VLSALGRAQWLNGDHKAALASWRTARGLDLLEPDIASLKQIHATLGRAG